MLGSSDAPTFSDGDRRGALFGLALIGLLTAAGLLIGDTTLLGETAVPALTVMIGTFVACVSARPLITGLVGVVSIAAMSVLSLSYELESGEIGFRVVILVVATGLAMYLAWERGRRDRTHELLVERNELALRFELLMREAPIGFVLVDRELRCVAVNEKMAQIDGASVEDHLGRRPTQVPGAAEAAEEAERLMASVLLTGSPVLNVAVANGNRESQGTRELQVSFFPVTAPGGAEIMGVGLTVEDVTERNRSERYLEELLRDRDHVARALQDSLLPPSLPEPGRLGFSASYLPAGSGADIGGDFYDVFETVDNYWHVVVGDICGKGLGAAAQIGLARHTLRAACVEHPDPGDTLQLLNAVLYQQDEADRFLTAAHLIIDLSHGTVSCAVGLGGHPPPLLVRDGEVTELGTYGPLLGIHEEVEIASTHTELHVGDLVVAYTDGLIEDRYGRFGEADLRAFLAAAGGAPADEVVTGLERRLAQERPGPPEDDVAIVAVRVER